MNVCLFTISFLPRIGGMEFVIHHLANTLTDMGCKVTVIAQITRTSGQFDHKYRLIRYGYALLGAGKSGANLLSSLSTIRKEHRHDPFDVVHCHSVANAGLGASIAKKFFGFPLVMTPHGEDIRRIPEINYGKRLSRLWDVIVRKNLLYADAVTAISDSVKNELNFVPDNKIFAVPNGIHINEFTPGRRHYLHKELSLDFNKKIILSVGRNHLTKGYEYGIRAFHLMDKTIDNHDLIYVIVGRGTENLAPLVQRLSLDKKVFLIPQKERATILKYYQSAWCFFSPSIVEGLSMVSIEAMASGLPLIVTDVPGNLDIVRENNCGIIVKNKDAVSMADGLSQLYSDQNSYKTFSETGLKCANRYDWDNIARKYMEVYRLAINNNGRNI